MKFGFESDDNLCLDKILSIPGMIYLLYMFFKKTKSIIYKLIYINVCINLWVSYKEYA